MNYFLNTCRFVRIWKIKCFFKRKNDCISTTAVDCCWGFVIKITHFFIMQITDIHWNSKQLPSYKQFSTTTHKNSMRRELKRLENCQQLRRKMVFPISCQLNVNKYIKFPKFFLEYRNYFCSFIFNKINYVFVLKYLSKHPFKSQNQI